jgi:hypothetical protein
MTYDIWHHLKNKNQWLYATPEPIDIVISCGDEAENTIFNQTGLLSLRTNSKAFTKNTLLISKYKNQNHFSKDFLPPFHLPNFTEDFNNIIMKQNLTYNNLDTIDIPRKFNFIRFLRSIFSPRKDQCDLYCQYKAGNLTDKSFNAHR